MNLEPGFTLLTASDEDMEQRNNSALLADLRGQFEVPVRSELVSDIVGPLPSQKAGIHACKAPYHSVYSN